MKNALLFLFTFFLIILLSAQEVSVTEQTGIESEISITSNPNNPDELIIASMGSGLPIIIYKSDNGGTSWNQTTFENGIADPVLTYGDNNTAYLTFLDFDSTLEMSLAKSSDNGLNWDIENLTLDGLAADRQWMKRDNSPNSPYYGNVYLSYFHPENQTDIHIVKVDDMGNVGTNHPIHTTNYEFVQNPAIDVSLNGNIVICFVSRDPNGNSRIMAVNSTDGSSSFSSESLVSDLFMYDSNGNPLEDVVGFSPGDASRLGNSLQMSIDKSSGPNSGRVYLTWTDYVQNNTDEGMNIYLSYSDDDGVNWSIPKIVNDDNVPSSHQYYSGIDVNALGVVCLSWYDRRNDPVNDALTDFYFSCSKDGGETFFPSVKINTVPSDHNAITNGLSTFGVGEYTSLTTSNDNAFIVWADGRNNNGDMDVYFAKVNIDAPLSIEEVNLSSKRLLNKVFPNPVSNGKIKLKLNTSLKGMIDLSIININGKVIQEISKDLNTIEGNILDINLENYSSGNYLIEIKHENKIAHKKFIISK